MIKKKAARNQVSLSRQQSNFFVKIAVAQNKLARIYCMENLQRR